MRWFIRKTGIKRRQENIIRIAEKWNLHSRERYHNVCRSAMRRWSIIKMIIYKEPKAKTRLLWRFNPTNDKDYSSIRKNWAQSTREASLNSHNSIAETNSFQKPKDRDSTFTRNMCIPRRKIAKNGWGTNWALYSTSPMMIRLHRLATIQTATQRKEKPLNSFIDSSKSKNKSQKNQKS